METLGSTGGLAQCDSSENGPRRRMVAAPFPLTLTLSLREREQRASRREQSKCLDCTLRRVEFTLSPRERAGVRGKKPSHGAARLSSPWRVAHGRRAIWLGAIHDFK